MLELNAMAAKKAKAHTVYKNMAGKRVPGVTTITGVMDKPALVKWANELGLQGINLTYVDELATVGTLSHYLIQCHLEKREPDLGDYTPNQISLAENGLVKFLYWQEDVGYEPIWCEKPLVSEKYQYGGTIDGYGVCRKRNGSPILLDIKTAKAIYDDHFTQVAGGYGLLLKEHNYPYEKTVIVRVGRNADEGERPEEKPCTCPALHEERFLVCRTLYEINRQIRQGSAR
jgi:hypothetical protein